MRLNEFALFLERSFAYLCIMLSLQIAIIRLAASGLRARLQIDTSHTTSAWRKALGMGEIGV